MISQKGQAMVEFVIILPLFLFFLFSIAYMGMIFADYISINDMARSCAREASYKTVKSSQYPSICAKYSPKDLPVGIYTWDKDNFSISTEDNGTRVQVQVTAAPNEEKGSIVNMMRNVTQIKDKFNINIKYSMYKEQN